MILLSILRSVNRRACSFSTHRADTIAGFKMLQTFEQRVFNPRCEKHITTTELIGVQKDETNQKQIDAEYEEAIRLLNELQSNDLSIAQSVLACCRRRSKNPEDTLKFLNRSGLSLDDLDRLSVIHVAGTKGKGSTCAITESILRAHNVKTGFFSSPHLVSATERIRINGQPIAKQKFTLAFWRVYKRLKEAQTHETDMPAYFKFLTILCFHIFLEEKVDVTVLEVGIGGELDCTNIVRNTRTVGITSLGLEHTELLGKSLEEIAWQKAGIIKNNSNVYTHVTQSECLEVIRERANARNAKVHIVPALKDYKADIELAPLLESFNDIIQLNGSLAIQLAYDWLRNQKNGYHLNNAINTTELTENVLKGLKNCHWPGRCQTVNYQNLNMHLDGAHTVESIKVCTEWFKRLMKKSKNPRVLLFNRTGTSDSLPLLRVLFEELKFDHVCFMPNFSSSNNANRKDMQTSRWHTQQQLHRATFHANNWQLLCDEAKTENNCNVYPSVADCLEFLNTKYDRTQEVDVLVTGSLHLIGATICALNDYEDCPARKHQLSQKCEYQSDFYSSSNDFDDLYGGAYSYAIRAYE